ncbi:MAG: HAD domain-containing protein [Bacteroidales bacterium]
MTRTNKTVIFLDIDGVLNRYNDVNDIHGLVDLSSHCVSVLNSFSERLDADIVLTSSWRFSDGIDEFLNDNGIEISGRLDFEITRSNKHESEFELKSRGANISLYIKNNGITDYIIIDDNDDEISLLHKGKFIHTNADFGLTPLDIINF